MPFPRCPGRPAVEITRQVTVNMNTGEVDIPEEVRYMILFLNWSRVDMVAFSLVKPYLKVSPGGTSFYMMSKATLGNLSSRDHDQGPVSNFHGGFTHFDNDGPGCI